MKRLITILVVTLVPAFAAAQPAQPQTVSNPVRVAILTNADLSTNPTTTDKAMKVDGYSLAMLKVRFTRGGLAEDIAIKCEESDDGSTEWSEITQIQSGVIFQFNPKYETTVSKKFTIRLDVTGFIYIRCTFTGTNSNSSDRVSLYIRRVRGI